MLSDMKITVGIDEQLKESDLQKLASLGADEFYCGIMPKEWTDVYGYRISTNRRYGALEHYTDWERLQKAISVIHAAGKKIIIAFNSTWYIEEHIPVLLGYVKKACDMGADALIVADMELFLAILELNIKIDVHVSSDFGAYNSQTAALFASLGAKRIIFPRHMSIDEMQGVIADNKNLEYECFIMEQRCPFDGAFCTPAHGWHRSNFCQEEFKRTLHKHLPGRGTALPSPDDFIKWKNNRAQYEIWSGASNSYDSILTVRDSGILQCGLCGIKRLAEIGITSLKIASRGVSKETAGLAVELVKAAISTPDLNDEFCRKLRAHPEICDMKYMCYYR